jgi:hypothetical protein
MTDTIEKSTEKSDTGIWSVIAFLGLHAWVLGYTGSC